MVARIEGFLTRSQLNLRSPRSRSTNITPQHGGCGIHYGGDPQRISSHSQCLTRWKSWQDYHMNHHGWSDIGYTGGVCDHGFAFAGRGFFTRTAAQGTNAGNQNFYGICWIGGGNETPSSKALDALDWWVSEARRAGNAGMQVRPHSFFKLTACPGNALRSYATTRNNKQIDDEEEPLKLDAEDRAYIKSLIDDIPNLSIPLGPAARRSLGRESWQWRRVLEVAAVHALGANEKPAPPTAEEIAQAVGAPDVNAEQLAQAIVDALGQEFAGQVWEHLKDRL